MPRSARRLLSRLSRMSWDELQTRLEQEVSKRLDVTLCRIGLQPGRNGVRLSSPAKGAFFFTSAELPQRVKLLREQLPEQAAKILADADQIRSHRFRLLGYRDLDYGSAIDWHLDAVHGISAPLLPWFKIDFLNFDEVGDHKVIWELNRHQHLVTLAKAWVLSGKKEYAGEGFAQWYAWQRANPYPLGANWASSLEVAFRSLSWIWIDHLLAEYPEPPRGFHEDLLHGLALNGRHIERYLSTYFSPNTHLLGEALALFFIGTLYPQISSAARWKDLGWKILQQEAVRQVRPDGVYFEQTLYYHVYALDFLLHGRLLASRNGVEISSGFDTTISKMLDFVQALCQCGPPDGFGDDDGGRLFDSSRNRSEHMSDPLALAAAMFPDEGLPEGIAPTEESIWLLGEAAITAKERNAGPVQTKSRSFCDGGIYVVTSSEPVRHQLVIDAGPQGTGHCGHGHADALSVRLSFAGRRWLVDCGTGSYIGSENDRDIFRGTRAHNTVAVDGLDQAQPEGPFAWSSIPDTQVESHISGPTMTLFVASHSGYERLPQRVRHRRFIVHFGGNLYLIRDLAGGEGTHLLETSWHFAPELQLKQLGTGFLATDPARGAGADFAYLKLLPVEDSRWKHALRSEYVSPCYGEKIRAAVLRCAAGVALPAETAMLLALGMGTNAGSEDKLIREDAKAAKADAPDAVYEYRQGNTSHVLLFARSEGDRWSYREWASDARLFYCRMINTRIQNIASMGGTFLRHRDTEIFAQPSPLQWLEWDNTEGQEQVTCSDPSVAQAIRKKYLQQGMF